MMAQPTRHDERIVEMLTLLPRINNPEGEIIKHPSPHTSVATRDAKPIQNDAQVHPVIISLINQFITLGLILFHILITKHVFPNSPDVFLYIMCRHYV